MPYLSTLTKAKEVEGKVAETIFAVIPFSSIFKRCQSFGSVISHKEVVDLVYSVICDTMLNYYKNYSFWSEIRTVGEKLLPFNLCDIDTPDSSHFPSLGDHPQIQSLLILLTWESQLVHKPICCQFAIG